LPFEHNSAPPLGWRVPLDDGGRACRSSGRGSFCRYTGASFDITSLKQAEIGLRTADQRKDEFIACSPTSAQPARPIHQHRTDDARAGLAQDDDGHTRCSIASCATSRMVNDLLDVCASAMARFSSHPERVELGEL